MTTASLYRHTRRLLPLWLGAVLCCLALPAFAATWSTGDVDNAGTTGQQAAMALDSTGKMHMSYYETTGKLKYATYQNGTVFVQSPNLVTSNVATAGTAIALDAAGNPQIAYYYGNTGIRNIAYSGSAWGSPVTINSTFTPTTGTPSSLVSKDGFSYVTFYRGSLYYARNNAAGDYSAWTATQVDSSNSSGRYNAIAVDSGGSAHVVGYDSSGTQRDIRYYTKASGSWVGSNIATSGNIGNYCAIAVGMVGGTETLFVVYLDNDNNNVMYTTKPVTGGSWSTPVVVAAAGSAAANKGGYISLAVDPVGVAHIAFFYSTNSGSTAGRLRYATNLGGSWNAEDVDASATLVGQYTSIAVDANQKVYIAYYDATNSKLKAATKDALLITPSARDFGTVDPANQSAPQTFTVTNNLTIGPVGNQITMGAAALSGANPSDFTITSDACIGLNLSPGTTCEVSAAFAPAAGTPLGRSAALTVSSSGPSVASVSAALSGTTTDNLHLYVSSGSGGGIAPNGTIMVPRGGSQAFTITPDAGFSVEDLVDNSVSMGPLTSYSLTNIQSDHTITVTFVSPFRIFGFPSAYFGAILTAYGVAANSDVIQSQGVVTAENLLVDRNITATLKGGYDSVFSSQTGSTTLHSILVHVPNDNPGRLIVEKVVLK